MLTDDDRNHLLSIADAVASLHAVDGGLRRDHCLAAAERIRAIAAPRVATVGELLATAPVERRLCEQDIIVLRPNRTYIFTVDPSCAKCVELARVADPSTRGPIGEG